MSVFEKCCNYRNSPIYCRQESPRAKIGNQDQTALRSSLIRVCNVCHNEMDSTFDSSNSWISIAIIRIVSIIKDNYANLE